MAELRPLTPPPSLSVTGTRSRARTGIIAGVAVVAAAGLGALLYLNVISPLLQQNQEHIQARFDSEHEGIDKADVQYAVAQNNSGAVINTASDPNIAANVFSTDTTGKVNGNLPVSICDANVAQDASLDLSGAALNGLSLELNVNDQNESDVIYDGQVRIAPDLTGPYSQKHPDRVLTVAVKHGETVIPSRPGLVRAESGAPQIFLPYVNDATGQVVLVPVSNGSGELRISACGKSISLAVSVDFKNNDTGDNTFATHNPSGQLDTRYLTLAWTSQRLNEKDTDIRSASLSGRFLQGMLDEAAQPSILLRGVATIYLSNDGGQTWTAPDAANRLVIGDEIGEQKYAFDDITYTFQTVGHDLRYAAYVVQDDNKMRDVAGNARGMLPIKTAHAATITSDTSAISAVSTPSSSLSTGPSLTNLVSNSLSSGTVLQNALVDSSVIQQNSFSVISTTTTSEPSSLPNTLVGETFLANTPTFAGDLVVLAPGTSTQATLDATTLYDGLTVSSNAGALIDATPFSASNALSNGQPVTGFVAGDTLTATGSLTAQDVVVPAGIVIDTNQSSIVFLNDAVLQQELTGSFTTADRAAFVSLDPTLTATTDGTQGSLSQVALQTATSDLVGAFAAAAQKADVTALNSTVDLTTTGALVSTADAIAYLGPDTLQKELAASLADVSKSLASDAAKAIASLTFPNDIYDARWDTDGDPVTLFRDLAAQATVIDLVDPNETFRFVYANPQHDVPVGLPVESTVSQEPFWTWGLSPRFVSPLFSLTPTSVSFQQLALAGLFVDGAQVAHPYLAGLHFRNTLHTGPLTDVQQVKGVAEAGMYWLDMMYQDQPAANAVDPVVPQTALLRLVANPPKRAGIEELNIVIDYATAAGTPQDKPKDEVKKPDTTTDQPVDQPVLTCEQLVETARAKNEVPPVCDQPTKPEDVKVDGAKISAQLIHRNDSRVIVKFRFDDAAEQAKHKDAPAELAAVCKEKGKDAKLTPKTYYDSKDENGYTYYFVLTGLKGGRLEGDNTNNLLNGSGQYGCDFAGAHIAFTTLNRPELVCYVQNRITGEIPNPRDCASVAKIREASFLKTASGKLLRDPEGLVFWTDPNLVNAQANAPHVEPVSRSGLPMAMILDKARKEFPQRVAATQIANARHQVLQGGDVPADIRELAGVNAKDEAAAPLKPVCDAYAVQRSYQVFHDRLYESDLYKQYDDAGVKFWKAQCSEIPEKDRLDIEEVFIGIASSEEQIDLFKNEFVQAAGSGVEAVANAEAAVCGYQVNFSFFQALKRPSEENANTFFCQKHDNLKTVNDRKALVRELALSDEQKNRLAAIEKADPGAFLPGCTQGDFRATKEVYNTCFNRPADIEGAKYWCQQPNLAPFDLNARFCEAGEKSAQ